MKKDNLNSAYHSTIVIYNCEENTFNYTESVSEMFNGNFDKSPIWQILKDENSASDSTVQQIQEAVAALASEDTPQVYFGEYSIKNKMGQYCLYSVEYINPLPKKQIIITLTEAENSTGSFHNVSQSSYDELTGILRRRPFARKVEKVLQDMTAADVGKFIVVYFDVQRFKAINDMFGASEGDNLLIHIANVMTRAVKENGFACRIGSDRFLLFSKIEDNNHKYTNVLIERLFENIAAYNLPYEITCNAGIYIVDDINITAGAAIDRAILAQSAIKGSYTKRYNYYKDDIRKNMLTEQEISGMMRDAIEDKQFVVYYQPQYNHSTGTLVGTEALVRWIHPDKGLVSPGSFIPIFEKNGFITELDTYVFERVCQFLRNCIDNNIPIVPISVNLTRYDIFSPNFIEGLGNLCKKYDVPTKYIHIEITESAALGNSRIINEAVGKLHNYGFTVEMDDFGSGYSSLNILKDIDFDVIKLDMEFLRKENNGSNKGGTILSSVVRMVNWLDLPMIAEGVETLKQADFLKSIGCEYIQGYYYSKPLPEEQYVELIKNSFTGNAKPQLKLIETLDSDKFWSYDSLETLIFSNYVGGAAIFEYSKGKIEILRMNQKYLSEIGMNLSEKELIESNPMDNIDPMYHATYIDMLKRAIETNDEQECETWRDFHSSCCGDDRLCIRSTVRMIGKNNNTYLFYAMIRNVTAEKTYYNNILNSEKRFKMASEQVNIYYWEYTVATNEMRPCFRCMRDLGLPALLTNYPESAIEMGVFPPEVADMYRDWHKQIANGVKSLEAVIPLTMDRIPFHVRYTTEFDENGHPIKAYGSAALVVD